MLNTNPAYDFENVSLPCQTTVQCICKKRESLVAAMATSVGALQRLLDMESKNASERVSQCVCVSGGL